MPVLPGLLADVAAVGVDVAEIAATGAVIEAGGMAGTGLAVRSLEVGALPTDEAQFAAMRTSLGVGGVMVGDGGIEERSQFWGWGFGFSGLRRRGGGIRGGWRGLGLRGIGDGRALGFEALEAIEGPMEGALGGVHAALEADEFLAGLAEDVAEGSGGVEVGGVLHFVGEELGFEAAEAAHEADGVNDGVEGVALVGGDGLVMAVVFVAEGFDESGILSREDEGLGFDAGLQGIEAGAGFALGGGGSGGLLGIEAVGLDLSDGCHDGCLSSNQGWGAIKKPLGGGREAGGGA